MEKLTAIFDRAKRLFSRDSDDEGGAEQSCFVFGKHPLWADHMPMIGEATAPAKRFGDHLYTCIQAALDKGVWRDIPDHDPKETFDHMVLFSQGSHCVTACMRSSEDSVGRGLYPLIVCTHANGQSFESLVIPGVRLTQDLSNKISGIRDVEEVKQAVEDAFTKWKHQMEATPPPSEAGQNMQRLAAAEALGPDRLGLKRIAYQLQSDASTFADMKGSEIKAERARFLRVPRLGTGSSLADDMMLWATFTRRVLPATLPLHIFASRTGGWMDLGIGMLAGEDLYCLQADSEAIPLTSTVPFEIPDDMPQTLAKLLSP